MRTINVTAEHIKKGKPHRCQTCPIALAIRDATLSEDISVNNWAVTILTTNWVSKVKRYRSTPLPGAACDFILRFDLGEVVEPFTFELDI